MHMKTHKKDSKLPCDAPKPCKSTFSSAQALQRHKKLHHPKEAVNTPCTNAAKGCKKVFSNESLLKEHLRVCNKGTPEEKRKCPYCHKEMAARYFNKHVRTAHGMQFSGSLYDVCHFVVVYIRKSVRFVARLQQNGARLRHIAWLDCF